MQQIMAQEESPVTSDTSEKLLRLRSRERTTVRLGVSGVTPPEPPWVSIGAIGGLLALPRLPFGPAPTAGCAPAPAVPLVPLLPLLPLDAPDPCAKGHGRRGGQR